MADYPRGHPCRRCTTIPPRCAWLTFQGPVNANRYPLCGLPEPVVPSSAATKSYVDGQVSKGTITIKQSSFEGLKITPVTLTIEELESIPHVMLSLVNIVGLRERLITYYLDKIGPRSFEIVSKMESNYITQIARTAPLSTPASTLRFPLSFEALSGAGERYVLANGTVGYPTSPGPVLLQSSGPQGRHHFDDITVPPVGQTIGSTGVVPTTAYQQGTELIYGLIPANRSSWDWHTSIVTSVIQEELGSIAISQLISFGDGVAFAIWSTDTAQSRAIVYYNSNYEGSGVWISTDIKIDKPVLFSTVKLGVVNNQIGVAMVVRSPDSIIPNVKSLYYNAFDPNVGLINDSTLLQSAITRSSAPIDVQGHPGIAFINVVTIVDEGVENTVFYPYYTVFNPSAQAWDVVQCTIDQQVTAIDLCLIQSYPAISFIHEVGSASVVSYVRALNSSGSSWSPAVSTIYTFNESYGFIFYTDIVLRAVGSYPAVVFASYVLQDSLIDPSLNQGECQYIISGDSTQFVQDAEFQANWTLLNYYGCQS